MKWVNHEIVTGVIVYGATGDFLATAFSMAGAIFPQGADVERGAIFICIGALLHIVEDAFCGKVPFLLPGQKVGIKLFKVGSVTEYLFSMAVVILTYIIHAQVMVK